MSGHNALEILHAGKRYGDTVAVVDLSLAVGEGEIVALLGPSGCGKTTTLRMVAGLEDPTAGEIRYDGRILASADSKVFVPPNKRNIGIVFQSYALWPHMTVGENIAHPLKVRRLGKQEIKDRVLSVLETVGLQGYAERPVPKLSGGQQQRVALARAIVYEPRLLLLDEPFSNLDALLRSQMRLELKKIQRRLGMTTLFVTHDQSEALSFADRIAVIDQGRLVQVGTPQEVYRSPASTFVRDFLGQAITVKGRLGIRSETGGVVVVQSFGGQKLQVCGIPEALQPGSNLEVSIRPEHIIAAERNTAEPLQTNQLAAVLQTLVFLGDHWEAEVGLSGALLVLKLPPTESWAEGQELALTFPAEALQVWDISEH